MSGRRRNRIGKTAAGSASEVLPVVVVAQITAGTRTSVQELASCLIETGKRFKAGLTISVVIPGMNDDPHGAFQPGCLARREGAGVVQQTVSVDEWLKADWSCKLLFELSTIAGSDDLVRVTPWLPTVGPLAALSLVLPRTAITGVRPATEEQAARARLVQLEFQPGSAIPLDELYRQLGDQVSATGAAFAIWFAVARGDPRLVRDFASAADVSGLIVSTPL